MTCRTISLVADDYPPHLFATDESSTDTLFYAARLLLTAKSSACLPTELSSELDNFQDILYYSARLAGALIETGAVDDEAQMLAAFTIFLLDIKTDNEIVQLWQQGHAIGEISRILDIANAEIKVRLVAAGISPAAVAASSKNRQLVVSKRRGRLDLPSLGYDSLDHFIELCAAKGMSSSMIALQCGLKRNTVRKRLQRIRERKQKACV